LARSGSVDIDDLVPLGLDPHVDIGDRDADVSVTEIDGPNVHA
jgi:hypothetical protein